MWSIVLRHYTCAKLAVLNDKLIAISGIARGMESHLECKNASFSRLRTKDLAHNLLWEVVSNTQNSPQSEFRAPTWSWTSLDIQLADQRYQSCKSIVTISSIVTTPVGDWLFFKYELKITGFLVKTVLVTGSSEKAVLESSYTLPRIGWAQEPAISIYA
jgi:hypothetical protein